ncbi:MAG TPA: hypothetical protein VF278_10540, partial [Pirellulales bacterium]
QEDLLSTALRYVLDELTVEEKAEFECRLLGRQDAREAAAEAVALCQPAKHALDIVSRGVTLAANGRPAEGVVPVQPASRVERFWRTPAAWATLVVAASIVLAVVMAGNRGGNPFATQRGAGVAADGISTNGGSVDGQATAPGSMAKGQTERGKQLLLAWLSFFPMSKANDAALTPDSTPATSEGDDETLAATDESFADERFEVDMEGGATLVDEDVIARVDAATAATDWVFEAVTAELSAAAVVKPREG